MSHQSARVSIREIAAFNGHPQPDAALLNWKSSILDRIAARTDDVETNAVAEQARAELSATRADVEIGGGR